MKKRTYKLLLTFLLSSAVSFGLLLGGWQIYLRQTERVTIFGHETTVLTEELIFQGDEIPDLATLQQELSPFQNLSRLDLGSFSAEAQEVEAFKAAFPKVELVCSTFVTLSDQRFPVDSQTLDLSRVAVSSEELLTKLPYFTSLTSLSLGEKELPGEERDRMLAVYPGLTVNANVVYDLYGMTVPEDVTELDLTEVTVDDHLVEHLKKFPSLLSVDLHGQPLTVEEQLTLREALPQVRFGWTVVVAGREVDSLTEELDLSGKAIDDLDALHQAVSLLCGLKKLVMCDCGISNEDMATLRDAFPSVKVVWRVYMGEKWSLRTDAVAFSVLIKVHDYTSMTSEDIEVQKYCTDLRALDLGHQAITDISVIGEYLTELRVLILADNKITDLSPLANLKHLHYLELFVNKITDLSPLASCTELVDLNLSYNKQLSDITPILNFPLLERLWIEHTSLSSTNAALLTETYPNAKVVTVGEGSVDQGWRTHERYYAMRDMWVNDYLSESFSKYDR